MRTLLFSPVPPWPTSRGGNQRTNLLYRALARFGEVDLVVVNSEPLSAQDDARLRSDFRMVGKVAVPPRGKRGAWSLLYPLAPALITRAAHNLGDHMAHYTPTAALQSMVADLCRRNKYDLVVGRYLRPTAVAGALTATVPKIVDIDDLEMQTYVSRVGRPGIGAFERRMLQWHIARYERVVPKVAAVAAHLWFAAEADLATIRHPSMSVLPNIPFIEKHENRAVGPSEGKTLLSVTSMNFPVNERAIDRFVNVVWPKISAQEPAARYVVVGSQMSEQQKARWSAVPGVSALGFVEDLAALYREAAFTVVPIFEGGGTKIKVLESLSFGRAAVVAAHSHRGYEAVLKDGECVSVADDEEELVQQCVELLRNPEMRNAIGAKGAVAVAKFFSFDRFAERVALDVDAVMHRRTKAAVSAA